MQVRKWLISGEINYNVCRICSLTLLPPEVLIPTPITLSVDPESMHVISKLLLFRKFIHEWLFAYKHTTPKNKPRQKRSFLADLKRLCI